MSRADLDPSLRSMPTKGFKVPDTTGTSSLVGQQPKLENPLSRSRLLKGLENTGKAEALKGLRTLPFIVEQLLRMNDRECQLAILGGYVPGATKTLEGTPVSSNASLKLISLEKEEMGQIVRLLDTTVTARKHVDNPPERAEDILVEAHISRPKPFQHIQVAQKTVAYTDDGVRYLVDTPVSLKEEGALAGRHGLSTFSNLLTKLIRLSGLELDEFATSYSFEAALKLAQAELPFTPYQDVTMNQYFHDVRGFVHETVDWRKRLDAARSGNLRLPANPITDLQ